MVLQGLRMNQQQEEIGIHLVEESKVTTAIKEQNINEQIQENLTTLLFKFHEVFTESIQLPPSRGLDHQIILQPNSCPVNLRPYRYPYG